MENSDQKDNSPRKIRLSYKYWKDLVQLIHKLERNSLISLSEKEKSILVSLNTKQIPACNPECDDFNERKIPYDFDTRVIAYLSTEPAFSEEDRNLILSAIMKYGKDKDQPMEKLSVHVIKEFRKAVSQPYAGMENQINTLRQDLEQKVNDFDDKDRLSKSFLNELVFMTESIQNILKTSTHRVKSGESEIITAFDQNMPSDKIISLIKHQNQKFIKYIKEESNKSKRDPLTGVYNRGAFEAYYRKSLPECMNQNIPVCLMIMDVDNFKRINDSYGKLAGDEALRLVTTIITEKIDTDSIFVARYGGEEFVAFLKGFDLRKGFSIAETLRINVDQTLLQIDENDNFEHITLSIGLAQTQQDTSNNPDELIKRADEALYRAKNTGRNKVCTM